MTAEAIRDPVVVAALCCPVCRAPLAPVPMDTDPAGAGSTALRCESGHSFDVARQGYVNLRSGRRPRGTADTADMVAARSEFLGAGYYAPIADAVGRAASGVGAAPPVVVDVGAGTGYYLARTLDLLEPGRGDPEPHGVAIDVSTYALRRAAKAHPRVAAVGADAWDMLPLRDGCAAAILDVFAPRNAAEFHRVLHPDGVLVVVTPSPDHLAELIGRFEKLGMLTVDERKDVRVEETLAERFTLESRHDLSFNLSLDAGDVGRLIRMGPSAHHVDDATLREALATLQDDGARTDVTASVTVTRFRPRRGGDLP